MHHIGQLIAEAQRLTATPKLSKLKLQTTLDAELGKNGDGEGAAMDSMDSYAHAAQGREW